MARRAARSLSLRVVVMLLMALAASACGSAVKDGEPSRTEQAIVEQVVDGDTIRIRGGRRVRFVQIDAPELRDRAECGGEAAARALRRQLAPGTRVRLAAEPASSGSDRFGRDLRYVFHGTRNINLWLVEQGLAAPFFYAGEQGRYAQELLHAARSARARGIGIWGDCSRAVLDPRRSLSAGEVDHE